MVMLWPFKLLVVVQSQLDSLGWDTSFSHDGDDGWQTDKTDRLTLRMNFKFSEIKIVFTFYVGVEAHSNASVTVKTAYSATL